MEKFHVRATWVFVIIAVASILAMVIWAFAPSWSQNHLLPTDILLKATLGSIMAIYLIRACSHPQGKSNMLEVWKWSFNLRTLSMTTAMLFFGVNIFGVNSPVAWVVSLHMITTALGTIFAYAEMYNLPEMFGGKILALIGITIGGGAFVISLTTEFITVAQGEAFAAAPLIIHILTTTKIQRHGKY